MRLTPLNALGTLGSATGPGMIVIASSDRSTVIPMCSTMPAVSPTSPTSGVLVIVLGLLANMAATMCLLTAFLAPRTVTSPRNGPDGSISHRLSTMGPP
nr:hypothetical protein [Microlunatus sp. Gsoil 973]